MEHHDEPAAPVTGSLNKELANELPQQKQTMNQMDVLSKPASTNADDHYSDGHTH